jgi:hypothetical protein
VSPITVAAADFTARIRLVYCSPIWERGHSMASEDDAIWHALIDDVQRGPLRRSQVLASVRDGTIDGADLVWRPGFENWVPLREVREFWSPPSRPERKSEAVPPPLPQVDVPTTPQEFEGVPVSSLIDTRHELTALIKENLYGGGSKPEGQAALIARNSLDKFVFRMTDDMLAKGKLADLAPLKRAIILETYSELLDILTDYSSRFGRGGKAVKDGMSAIVSDPDVFGRFNAEHQAKIQAIATGSSLFAKSRFDELHLSIRAEAGRHM